MTISAVISIGSVSETFALEWAFWTSVGGIIISLLVFSYKFGYKKGQQETCHDQYSFGYEKGLHTSKEDEYKRGFSDGFQEGKKSTKPLTTVSCQNHPKDDPLLNGIKLLQRVEDGRIIDVECQYLEQGKICMNTSQRCIKLSV